LETDCPGKETLKGSFSFEIWKLTAQGRNLLMGSFLFQNFETDLPGKETLKGLLFISKFGH
jgi:hypothetical protein